VVSAKTHATIVSFKLKVEPVKKCSRDGLSQKQHESQRPFVAGQCAALPENPLRNRNSSLRKGAFTGAMTIQTRPQFDLGAQRNHAELGAALMKSGRNGPVTSGTNFLLVPSRAGSHESRRKRPIPIKVRVIGQRTIKERS
jgi:hypothetical protein